VKNYKHVNRTIRKAKAPTHTHTHTHKQKSEIHSIVSRKKQTINSLTPTAMLVSLSSRFNLRLLCNRLLVGTVSQQVFD